MSVPMADNVNTSLKKFLSSELRKLENECFCPSCNSCKESVKDTSFIQSASVLVIHLKRFCIEHDKVIKDNQFFKCFLEDPLQIRITDSNEVSFSNSYSLVATINYSGSYQAIIKDDTTNNGSLAMIKLSLKLKLMT